MILSNEELVETCFELLSTCEHIDETKFSHFVETVSTQREEALRKECPDITEETLALNVAKLKKAFVIGKLPARVTKALKKSLNEKIENFYFSPKIKSYFLKSKLCVEFLRYQEKPTKPETKYLRD